MILFTEKAASNHRPSESAVASNASFFRLSNESRYSRESEFSDFWNGTGRSSARVVGGGLERPFRHRSIGASAGGRRTACEIVGNRGAIDLVEGRSPVLGKTQLRVVREHR